MGRMANVEGSRTSGEGTTVWFHPHSSLTQMCYLQLITSMDGGKRSKPEDNIGMLEQLRAADPSAASLFLEHLILRKRSDVRTDNRWWFHLKFSHLHLRIDDYMKSSQIRAWISCLITSLMTRS